MYRGKHCNDSEPGAAYAKHVKDAVDKIKSEGRAPAAWFCEGLLSTAGYVPLPPDYLKKVYHYIRAEGGVCVSDEVQVWTLGLGAGVCGGCCVWTLHLREYH